MSIYRDTQTHFYFIFTRWKNTCCLVSRGQLFLGEVHKRARSPDPLPFNLQTHPLTHEKPNENKVMRLHETMPKTFFAFLFTQRFSLQINTCHPHLVCVPWLRHSFDMHVLEMTDANPIKWFFSVVIRVQITVNNFCSCLPRVSNVCLSSNIDLWLENSSLAQAWKDGK